MRERAIHILSVDKQKIGKNKAQDFILSSVHEKEGARKLLMQKRRCILH